VDRRSRAKISSIELTTRFFMSRLYGPEVWIINVISLKDDAAYAKAAPAI